LAITLSADIDLKFAKNLRLSREEEEKLRKSLGFAMIFRGSNMVKCLISIKVHAKEFDLNQ